MKVLNDLDLADDITLLESTIPRVQAQLASTAAAAKDLGLIISVPKTEYMAVNCHPHQTLQVYGESVHHVTDFRYLVSKMASAASDLKRHKALLVEANFIEKSFFFFFFFFKFSHKSKGHVTKIGHMADILKLFFLECDCF